MTKQNIIVAGMAFLISCSASQRAEVKDAVVDCLAVNAVELDKAIAAMQGKQWSELPRIALGYPIAVGGCALVRLLATAQRGSLVAEPSGDALRTWATYKAQLAERTSFVVDGVAY